jgi:hypothetical protein
VRFRNRRLISLLLVAFASVAVVALSACGGGSSDSGDAKKTLTDAFKNPIKSANVSLDISAKIDGVAQLSQPISIKLSGPFESQGKGKVPKLDWDINVSGSGQTFSGKLVSTGDNAFVGFQGQTYEVGTQLVKQYEQQLAQQTGQQGLSAKQLGIDPASWIKNATNAGEEDVAGVTTTKITGGLDIAKMLTDLNSAVDKAGPAMGGKAPAKLTPQQIDQVKQIVKDPTFEAFVGKDDGKLRRLSSTVNFTVPENQRAKANGATGGALTFSLEFADVGKPVTITAPTGAKPITELQQQLQGGGLGGIGGGSSAPGAGSGSGSGGSGGSGGGNSSQKFQAYAQCLTQANGDQAKIQECSKLLQ